MEIFLGCGLQCHQQHLILELIPDNDAQIVQQTEGVCIFTPLREFFPVYHFTE